jgi:hypothetical protein
MMGAHELFKKYFILPLGDALSPIFPSHKIVYTRNRLVNCLDSLETLDLTGHAELANLYDALKQDYKKSRVGTRMCSVLDRIDRVENLLENVH